MPRKSPESIAAAYYRTKGKAPAPPAHLDADAKRIWQQITASRPPDFFTVGALPLLEAYVTALVMHRWYMDLWKRDAINRDGFVKPIAALNANLSMLATKLRLAITSVDKRSGILTEKGDVTTEDNVIKADILFGGNVQKW
jgi:hypothetical protein